MKKLLFILIAAVSLLSFNSCEAYQRAQQRDYERCMRYQERGWYQGDWQSSQAYRDLQYSKRLYRLNSLKYSIESHRR